MTCAIYFFLSLLALTVALMLYNLIFGQYTLIKYLAVNIITACAIVVVSLIAALDSSRACYLDIAIIYGLISFIFNIAVMKYLKEIKG